MLLLLFYSVIINLISLLILASTLTDNAVAKTKDGLNKFRALPSRWYPAKKFIILVEGGVPEVYQN